MNHPLALHHPRVRLSAATTLKSGFSFITGEGELQRRQKTGQITVRRGLPFCEITLKSTKPKMHGYPRALETLGDHLRQRRLDLGLSQTEVAKRLAVNLSTINHWEGNLNAPAACHLARIIDFLGYDPTGTALRPDAGPVACAGSNREKLPEMDGSSAPSGNLPKPVAFRQCLLRRRLKLGLSQAEAAKVIGVSRIVISEWETGKSLPDHRALPAAIRFLGMLPVPVNQPDRLRFFRQALGLSPVDFARRFKADRHHLSLWETGRKHPQAGMLDQVQILIDAQYPSSDFPRVALDIRR